MDAMLIALLVGPIGVLVGVIATLAFKRDRGEEWRRTYPFVRQPTLSKEQYERLQARNREQSI